ncbi:MAG: site-specific DNA-methyltransferase [Pseudoalteromonas sp.]|nr:site-specific DNA-methyltransferase [Pseudoalteromonas sp.]
MLGDCLERIKEIPSGSVDMILTDPPYGTTACKWDSIIPLEPMWEQIKRIIKPNGVIALTAQQPFTSKLICSQIGLFRYTWVWDKGYSTGFANANKMPMKRFEDVCVFYKKLPTYKPQGVTTKIQSKCRVKGGSGEVMGKNSLEGKEYTQKLTNYPKSLISTKKTKSHHPTGKPVALMEYLIKTYTNESETVLDFTMGSGSTGVAAKNLNRKFIGIEMDEGYFEIAKKRINEA